MSLANAKYKCYNYWIVDLFYDMLRHCPRQVIQRRVDNTTDFFRDWKSYKDGFGNLRRNFWLGGSLQLTSCSSNYWLEAIQSILYIPLKTPCKLVYKKNNTFMNNSQLKMTGNVKQYSNAK